MERAWMCVRSSHHITSLFDNCCITPLAELYSTWACSCFSAVPTPESDQKKRKRKRDGGGRLDSEEDAEGKKKKKKENQRPNYFISIPITNPQVENSSALGWEVVFVRSSCLIKIFFSRAVQLGNRCQLKNTKLTPVYMYVFIWLTRAFAFSLNAITARLLYVDSKEITVSRVFIWERKIHFEKTKSLTIRILIGSQLTFTNLHVDTRPVDQFSHRRGPRGGASAGAPAGQSPDSGPKSPHHSVGHLPRQSGAS